MKYVTCYNCSSDTSTFYASENGYTLVKCITCGLLFVNPRPDDDEIDQAHKVGLHRGDTIFNITGRYDRQRAKELLMILRHFFERELQEGNKTWLDIGCGHGELLVALSKISNKKVLAKGLEPNIYKQKSASQKGLDVSYFDLDQHFAEYDFISLLNVYSHLPDPVLFLKSIKKNLKKNGQLLIETGDTEKFTPETHVKPLYLPDHLSFASEKIIVDILKRNGFTIIKVKKYPFINLNMPTVAKEIAKLLWPNKKSRLRYLLQPHLYAEVDMFIHAAIINS